MLPAIAQKSATAVQKQMGGSRESMVQWQAMDKIQELIAIFRRYEGWNLAHVWTEESSQDRPTSQSEIRIVLDFTKDNAVRSIYIRIDTSDAGLNVLRFGEYG